MTDSICTKAARQIRKLVGAVRRRKQPAMAPDGRLPLKEMGATNGDMLVYDGGPVAFTVVFTSGGDVAITATFDCAPAEQPQTTTERLEQAFVDALPQFCTVLLCDDGKEGAQ
jgi:hypothetical protein